MLISEAKKGIKCYVQGYTSDLENYIEGFGVIAKDPSLSDTLIEVVVYRKKKKERIRIIPSKVYWIDQNFEIPGYHEEESEIRITLELPEELREDYLNDKLHEALSRVYDDIDGYSCCGKHEKEVIGKLREALLNSKRV